jgi:hypothetical protein
MLLCLGLDAGIENGDILVLAHRLQAATDNRNIGTNTDTVFHCLWNYNQGPPQTADSITAMSQRTFASQLILTWAIVGVPVFLAFRYFESQKIMEDLGVGNTIIMAVVLSSIPAIIICMAWRYLRKQR